MQKKKLSFRVASLVSLVFLAQCCCCILPVGWEVRQNFPVVQQFLEQVEILYQDAAVMVGQFSQNLR